MRSSKAFENPGWVAFEESRLGYRFEGYAFLSGHGIEIGAMDHPANLPKDCEVSYADALTPEAAKALFPELGDVSFIDPDYLCDLDKDNLEALGRGRWDFVVMNHVIEHVANPLRVLENSVLLLRPGGHLVLSAPDRRYTFDRNRDLTSFEHLYEEYLEKTDHVTFSHYLDYIRNVHPEILDLPEPHQQKEIQKVKDRREHVHVWDSSSFRDFLDRGFKALSRSLEPEFEQFGETTEIEYFGVWRLR